MNTELKNYIDGRVKKVNTLAHNGYDKLDNRVSLLEEMAKDDLYTTSTDSTTALVKQIPTKALSVFYLNNVGGCVTKSDNLIVFPNIAETTTSGITYKVTDGVIYVKGTNSAGANVTLDLNSVVNTTETASITFNSTLKSSTLYYALATSVYRSSETNASYTGTISYLNLVIGGDFTQSSYVTIKPMLVKGSTAPTTWSKGYSGLSYNYPQSVEMVGKNMVEKWYAGDVSSTDGSTTDADISTFTSVAHSPLIEVKPSSTYYLYNFSSTAIANQVRYFLYDDTNTLISTSLIGTLPVNGYNAITTTSATKYIRYKVVNVNYAKTLITADSSITEFVDYKKTTLQSAEMWASIKERVGDLSLGYKDDATGKWVQTKDADIIKKETISSRQVFKQGTALLIAPASNFNKSDNVYVSLATIARKEYGYYYFNLSDLGLDETATTDEAKTALFTLWGDEITIVTTLASNVETDISDILEDCGVEVNSTYGQVCRGGEGGGTIVITTNTGLAVPSKQTYLIKTV